MKVKVVSRILEANDRIAEENRKRFREAGVFVANLMGAPGAGKTTLLERTIQALKPKLRIGVIEGDIVGTDDAERISAPAPRSSTSLLDLRSCSAIQAAIYSPSAQTGQRFGITILAAMKYAAWTMHSSTEKCTRRSRHTMARSQCLMGMEILYGKGTKNYSAVCAPLNGDGTSEIITGGEYGALKIINATNGEILFTTVLGQAISEVREVELNGDPSSREIVVGGKDGGVWAFSFDGSTANQIWSGSMSDKVTEIAGIDINDDGKEEAVIGDDSGKVAIFTENRTRNNLPSRSNGIARIVIGKLGSEKYIVVADLSEIQVNKVNFSSLPGFQYPPLIVGIIVSAVILVIAAILASIPKKPEMKVSFQDTTRESLDAQRRMLKESIADVERLRKDGEVTGDAYLARLKRLRADLADNEAAFKKQGYAIKVETIQCPNCGGTLELGMDKCEYCGQVLLS